jgi:L-asparaginase
MLPGGPLGAFDPRIDERVLVVRVFPGLDPGLLSRALASGVRGLVLEGYGTGNLPHKTGSLIPVLEQAACDGAPVLVVSQCFKGGVELSHYRGGAAARAVGAIPGGDMTVEAAVVKMMIALGRHQKIEDIRAFLEANVVGERSS